MSNIEEDIQIVKRYLENSSYKEKDSNFFKNGGWEIVDLEIPQAMSNIIKEREQDKKRIKELEEENKLLLNGKVGVDLSYDDYIPVQKVNDEIEKYEYMLAETIHGEIQKYTPREILLKIDTLKELLEEK